MYGILWLGDATHPPALCEAYPNGMIYEVHRDRRWAERATASLNEMWPGHYRAQALPGWAPADEDFSHNVYIGPHPWENPHYVEPESDDMLPEDDDV